MVLLGIMKGKIGHCKSIIFCLLLVFICSCNHEGENKQNYSLPVETIKKNPTPDFCADSAYEYVKTQVDFGPRVPGSESHEACASFLEEKFKKYAENVIIQSFSATTFDRKRFSSKNIIASFNSQMVRRILLCAHWDTRPFADRDSLDTDKPIDGANDGASGVGVLIEVARQINILKPGVGVDIIFFDLEDYGQPQNSKFPDKEDTWCLGSQYWSKNTHKPGYYADFAILLDMVGGKNAIFPMEGTSMYYAPTIVEKVWNIASKVGYSNYFVTEKTGQTTDDHLYVNEIAKIPCIDIVHYEPSRRDYGFFHHRHSDNLEVIDKQTLKAVGQTLLEVIYSE